MRIRSSKSYKAKRYRLTRRFSEVFGDFFRAGCVLLSVAVLSCAFIYVYTCFLSSPYFEIKETSVRGLKELTEKDVLTLAQVKPAQNLLAVNKSAIEKRILANPWVKNIYIGRELPDRLVLELRERQPVALLKEKNDFYLIDTEGNVFKKVNESDEIDLPVISGLDGKEAAKTPSFLEALRLIDILHNSSQYAYLGIVSEVNVSKVFGLGVLTEKGFYFKLGTDGFESKLKNLKIVMDDLAKRELTNGWLCIDLVNPSKITIQQKNLLIKEKEREGSSSSRYQI